MGDQCRLLAILVPMPEAADAVADKVLLQPVDQRQIAAATHRWKADQSVKDLT
jgi:hypothetical protein